MAYIAGTDYYDDFEMGFDYEKNRLKYFKEALITSKIIKSIGGIGMAVNIGLFTKALIANMNIKDLDEVGLLFLLFLYIYYRGNKGEIEAISDYAEYLEPNNQSLLLTKN